MRLFSSSHDFDYPFKEVSLANWRKYCPWNHESDHVIAVDTLSRRLMPDSGVLRTERLITCKQPAPKWLTPFLGGTELSHVYEVSYVTPFQNPQQNPAQTPTLPPSPPTRTSSLEPSSPPHPKTISPSLPFPPDSVPHVHMRSQNLTWSDLLRVHEIVTYTPSPADPAGKTRFEQKAEITALVGGWEAIRQRIEQFTVERFGQNADRGRKGFEEVLESGGGECG